MRKSIVIVPVIYASLVIAHGNITSPPARLPGPVMSQVCGAQAVAALVSDGTQPVEDLTTSGAAGCNIFLCKGAQFADNQDNVQTFAPGQVVPFKARLPIPHEGPCNVSIIDLASNSIVGQPLLSFASYADERLASLPPNNTAFNVTMPSDLETQCQVPGECALQWFWFGTAAVQTYESCVDFVMASAEGDGAPKENATTVAASAASPQNAC